MITDSCLSAPQSDTRHARAISWRIDATDARYGAVRGADHDMRSAQLLSFSTTDSAV